MAQLKNTSTSFMRQDLIHRVASKTPYTEACIRKVIVAVFESITEIMKEGSSLQIRGFGTFLVRHRKAGQVRNPTNGQLAEYPARCAPGFKSGSRLKQVVRDGVSSC